MSRVAKRVMFLSPHAGIWSHALAESFIAKALQSPHFEVSRVICDGTYRQHCTVMSSIGMGIDRTEAEQQRLCKLCVKSAGILAPAYGDENYRLSQFLDDQDFADADRLTAELTQAGLPDLRYCGVEVGKLSTYEILIRFKKTSLTFTDEEFRYVRAYARNSLLSLAAFRKIFATARPQVLLIYSPQYGVNGVCAKYAELQGCRVYFLEGSSNIDERYRAMRVWDWSRFGLTNPALKYWSSRDRAPVTAGELERAKRHTQCLMNASSFSVYSAPAENRADLKQHFGVPQGSKVLLAAMSSYDEVFSAYVIERFPPNKYFSDVFANQLEWIAHTIHFMRSRPDLFLIIRIHPRTFPSKRNSVMAHEQAELARLFADLPGNVRVNYPEERISIYDLFKEVDVLITGWSATGVEAMTAGIPVVTYDTNVPSYPASIHFTGDSREQYEINIAAAAVLSRTRAADVSRQAYEWMAFSMSRGVVQHPAMLRNEPAAVRSRALGIGVRVLERLVPVTIKRIEAGRSMSAADAQKLQALLLQGLDSLYDS